jgi:hypothetical protein
VRPEICPILSLGLFFLQHPFYDGQVKLFEGSSQYNRYLRALQKICSENGGLREALGVAPLGDDAQLLGHDGDDDDHDDDDDDDDEPLGEDADDGDDVVEGAHFALSRVCLTVFVDPVANAGSKKKVPLKRKNTAGSRNKKSKPTRQVIKTPFST